LVVERPKRRLISSPVNDSEKTQRGGKIRTEILSYPLSEDPSLADFECVILAERMRECWRGWNHSHPFTEILDHRRVGDIYEVTVRNYEGVELGGYLDTEGVKELLLARFIQELYFLNRRGRIPEGRFDCVLEKRRGYDTTRIALIPVVPKFRGKAVSIHKRCSDTVSGCELTDVRGIMKLAIKRLGIGKSTRGMGNTIAEVADWLGRSCPPVPLPINYRDSERVPDEGWISASVTEKMAKWPTCCYGDDYGLTNLEMKASLSKNRPMRILTSKLSYTPEPDSPRIRVKYRTSPPKWKEEESREWGSLIRWWNNCLKEWEGSGDLDGKSGVRIRATLEAESFQLLRGCYAVEFVPNDESGAKKGEYGFRLLLNERHPLFGEIKREGGGALLDRCIENATFEVRINDDPSPLNFAGVGFKLERTKVDDPNILILSGMEGKQRPPETGWLRINDRGTAALQRRKQDIVSTAIKTRAIRDGLWNSSISKASQIEFRDIYGHSLRGWEERHPDWRVTCYGKLQVIQGPPGTGKTWTATRIVEDILRDRPNARILLCAKEHLALEHLAKSVKESLSEREYDGFEITRIVSGRRLERGLVDEELDPSALGRAFTEQKISATASISQEDGFRSRINSIRESMVQEGHSASWPSGFLRREASVVCVTTCDGGMLELVRDAGGEAFDYAIVEEAGKSYPSELVGAVAVSRNTILIGDQMQLPPFEIQDIKKNLLRILSVDQDDIGKEKGKYRVLEKLLRDVDYVYEKWGPEKTVEDIRPWLEPFGHIFEIFEEMNSGYVACMADGYDETEMPGIGYIGRLSSRLEEERRMFEELSDVVGMVFYGRPFVWMKEGKDSYDESLLPSLHREHGRMILVDTPHCTKNKEWRESRSKTGSFCNKNEADIVANTAKIIASGEHKVVVLSPYQGQVDLIKKKLGKRSSVEVNTVDGFQGKESDFVLLSLVRNNEKTARGRWGFVCDPNRLNVALSRAREGLIVFTSLKHVNDTEFKEGDDYLRKAIEMIGDRGQVILADNIGGV
jgi:hypothetical protein